MKQIATRDYSAASKMRRASNPPQGTTATLPSRTPAAPSMPKRSATIKRTPNSVSETTNSSHQSRLLITVTTVPHKPLNRKTP